LEVIPPVSPLDIDTSQSFELKDLPIRYFDDKALSVFDGVIVIVFFSINQWKNLKNRDNIQQIKNPSPLHVLYNIKEDDKFFVTYEGKFSGLLFLCGFSLELSSYLMSNFAVKSLRYSRTKRLLVSGNYDGSVRIFEVDNKGNPSRFWESSMHRALVNGVATSFDDSYLLTVGQDGNFFVYRINDHDVSSPPLRTSN
jgi:WD40 repeat protein